MLDPLIILLSYALLGAGVKYADQAYDIQVFNKRIANFLAIPGGVLMALLILSDSTSATIFLGMFIALALTKKIDNIAFYVGAGILILLPIIFHDTLKIEWVPFGILIFSGVIDELGNDWADKRVWKRMARHVRSKERMEFKYKFSENFFLHRFMMKVAVFFLAFFNFFSWLYFFAFLLFDIMYLLVEKYSFRLKTYSIGAHRS